MAAVDEIQAKAAEVAAANPPSRVLAALILGIFTVIGFLLGRIWFFIAGSVAFVWLAFLYGIKSGAKTRKAQK